MEYTDLLDAIEGGEEEVQRYLQEDVLVPCVEGHENCNLDETINDYVDVGDDYLKPDFLNIRRFKVIRSSELVYRSHVHSRYRDTFSAVEPNEFVKCNVDVVMEGESAPDASIYDGMVLVNPYEKV